MLFSASCREFNSLPKRYTALLHRTNTFTENKIIRSVVGGKVDGKILFGPRSEKPKIICQMTVTGKNYLAVKGLNGSPMFDITGLHSICNFVVFL